MIFIKTKADMEQFFIDEKQGYVIHQDVIMTTDIDLDYDLICKRTLEVSQWGLIVNGHLMVCGKLKTLGNVSCLSMDVEILTAFNGDIEITVFNKCLIHKELEIGGKMNIGGKFSLGN